MKNLGNLFILGDSYSTFQGYIPEGYEAWYWIPEEPRMDTDVTKVEETWWHILLENIKANLLLNCSWSGTTICNTGYEGSDCSDISFIARLDKLIEAGYFEENHVDTFLVFGGTNDSWADAPVGELKYSDWTKSDLYQVLPAFGYLLHRLTTKLPDTRIICVINTELKLEIHDAFLEACNKYGVETVELKGIAKDSGHPNILGMSQIEEQVEKVLLS